jgi:nucleotide-binding universal stress UspA family protein
MEKILLAMDGQHQNSQAIDFACYISRLNRARLIGIFLEGANDGTGSRKFSHEPIFRDEYTHDGKALDPVSSAVRQFREACVCRDVSARVHRDRGIPMQELIHESRFADLIVIDPECGFEDSERKGATGFIEHFLHDAECPVILAPFSFNTLDTVYFTYDGSESSVHAMKQFTYLFPEMATKHVVVISVVEGKDESDINHYRIKEWISTHYQDAAFITLTGKPSDELFGFLLEKKDAIVVIGAYGRSSISRAFFPSHARLMMKAINLPLFIAHK